MTTTFDMHLTGVVGGPCPVCGHNGELLRQFGSYDPDGRRTLVHTTDGGGEQRACELPTAAGMVYTEQGLWWFHTAPAAEPAPVPGPAQGRP